MVVRTGEATASLEREKGANMHDYLTRLEVLRHHREELREEAENARLAREARRGRRGSGGEWKINLGGWVLQLRRIREYGTSPAPKG